MILATLAVLSDLLPLRRRSCRRFRRLRVGLSLRRPHHRTLRGMGCLAHAVEYLEETMPLGVEVTPRVAAVEQSITILRACHRSAFLSCSAESQQRAAEAFR